MLGYSPKELINQPVSNFSAKDGEKKYQNWLQNESRKYFQELEELGPKSFIGSMQRKDGTFIDIAYNGWAVSVGGRNYILNLIRDVSHNAIQRACDNIRSEVLTLVMGATPLTECLRSIIMSLESNIPERYAAVLLNTNGKIQHIIAPSLRPEYSTFITQQRNAQTQDSLHQSASNQKTVIIENVSATEYEQSEEHISAALTDARSCWILPLFSSTHDLLGLLTLYSTQTGRPQSGEIELLQNASNLLALTIEHRQITEKLAHQAEHDALTNLPNRLLFQDRLQQAITSAQRRGEQVAVLFLDLDGFKHVNDTLGHAGGDILLQQVARRLEKSMRRSDTVARVGGDEFTVMLPDVKHPDDTVIIAQKIIDAIKEPFDILAHEIYVTTSVGIAVYPQDSNDTNELQRQADAAMYKAKNCGKNCYAFFEEAIGQELQERLELKTQLRRAFENREFELYYQPQINLASGHVVSLEALIRWRHPKLGMVLPLSFIPAAEESGIILKIGAWVVDEACRQLALWRQDEIHMNRITVNISALQFGQQEFFQIIKKTLETHNIQPQYLELEITESVMVRNIEESVRQMTRLKNLGVSIALDDFGTGYSSLSYLQKLPVSTLKIDRSFVQGIETRNETQLLVQAVVTLATGLGLTVTAEGIETEAELKTLKQLGCHLAQGYYLAEPMHASGTARFLQNYVMSKSLQLPSASR
jgi:diguanylate cyclase (GGDEF)-like protein